MPSKIKIVSIQYLGYYRAQLQYNRPFPSSSVPQFQSECKCETIPMKMTLICMKMKLHSELIFIRKVWHLDSFWNRGIRELGNDLLVRDTNMAGMVRSYPNSLSNILLSQIDKQQDTLLSFKPWRTRYESVNCGISNWWSTESERTHQDSQDFQVWC